MGMINMKLTPALTALVALSLTIVALFAIENTTPSNEEAMGSDQDAVENFQHN